MCDQDKKHKMSKNFPSKPIPALLKVLRETALKMKC